MPDSVKSLFESFGGLVATVLAAIVGVLTGYGALINRVSTHKRVLFDSDGNERYLTKVDHKDICHDSRDILAGKIELVRSQQEGMAEDLAVLVGDREVLHHLVGRIEEASKKWDR